MNLLVRRFLTLVLALAPLAAQADACTLGAVTGRTDVQCGMEMAMAATPVVATEAGSCPYCHADAPASPAPSHGVPAGAPTCCDLKPQATAAVVALLPGVPLAFEHPAIAPVEPAPEAPVAAFLSSDPDVGRAPPGPLTAPLPPRAPPLG